MVSDVPALSRQAIYDWLDALQRLIAAADERSLAALAQTELVNMTKAWRAMLREHEPTEDRACRTCARRRRDRHNRCQVWASAHRLLLKGETLHDTEPHSDRWSDATVSTRHRPTPGR